jgi:lysophospholipase L1-like esterase
VRFDWPAVAAFLSVAGVGSISLNVTSQATGGLNRALTHVFVAGAAYEMTRAWITPGNSIINVVSNVYGNSSVRVFFELEPSFNGAAADAGYVVHGFVLDAGDAVQQQHRAHKLEIVGDSISAGYGASGVGGGCPVMDYTSGNFATYNRLLCDAFDAECSVVAWSGKGMMVNCCDLGETMPSYYLQTRGGEDYSSSWDFTRFVPDAIIINLGTNDFGHDSGPAWEANFSAIYTAFVLNATRRYGNPSLPVFLAQGNINNGTPLQNALQVAAAAINAAGGNATYLDLRVGPIDGCGGHPGVLGHAAMANAAKPTIAATMGWAWTYAAGYIPTGDDAAPPAANLTLAAAKAGCLALPACVAITFAGVTPDPAPAVIPLIYFKTVSGVAPDDGWQSYVSLARA